LIVKEKMVSKRFRVTFLPEERTVEMVHGEALHGDGEPGSILQIATHHGIELDHACGGVCACATCHVKVVAGSETCNESSDEEEDQLDLAPHVESISRLACQCIPDGSSDVVVAIPTWNRNRVPSGH
jgi:2Fe-2S ferredoxin